MLHRVRRMSALSLIFQELNLVGISQGFLQHKLCSEIAKAILLNFCLFNSIVMTADFLTGGKRKRDHSPVFQILIDYVRLKFQVSPPTPNNKFAVKATHTGTDMQGQMTRLEEKEAASPTPSLSQAYPLGSPPTLAPTLDLGPLSYFCGSGAPLAFSGNADGPIELCPSRPYPVGLYPVRAQAGVTLIPQLVLPQGEVSPAALDNE
ncbi:hypothetical protein DUI87_24873 [Hirundo rustica rustica]|uniref:Uncharacterized protein n=1 Tax=Hirundo rustica rustica TaxID=333673 RepID=A0A3M0JCF6_HIRRU|nr:hypothetical protein DUI87_24873 [Hirundo rustica rustica]